MYQENSFVPSAKIQGEAQFSIISDYIGRPVQCYSENGSLVWSTDYDIYGGLRDLKGEKSFIPFRQLGQYEDLELEGLYYNRFRFYDAETGLYLSQDPIGLAGNNPTFYGYVADSNTRIDPFGLSPSPLSGFKSFGQMNQFGTQVQASMSRAGFKGTDVFMQGSSVTGRSFSTGELFDVGRKSDFDVALVNKDLLKKAESLDLAKTGRPYSMPLDADAMRKLGFGDLADSLSKRFGRDVNFRIFDSEDSVRSKGKSYKIKCG
ncbi:RHS repeat-associated core domain-containing protein [Flavobacterium columnare]|uniref:RHS repeat domain-containing protein n=1 Tax=Flavobacterium columnare TaxID=996 RepID=UPI0026BDEE7E|nr:RHS repeat-associated core domain-containing protein [Flavobacterium columnare]